MASQELTSLRFLLVILALSPLWESADSNQPSVDSYTHLIPLPQGATTKAQDLSIRTFDNSVKSQNHIGCGTVVTNLTSFVVKNPHHPEPTYSKVICEIVIEKFDRSINKLQITLNHLELYRANMNGDCMYDKFGVFSELNSPMSPILCGTQTGKSLSIPFLPKQQCLIVSIITSDLDHERSWVIEIEQVK